MAFLPEGIFANASLVLIFAGMAFIVLRKDVPKAYGIGLLVLVLFGLDTTAQLTGRFVMPHQLGYRADDFLAGRTWWSPITSVFVHAGFGHIFGNLFILVTAGPALEDRIGGRRFLIIFGIAALAALAAQTLLAYATNVTQPNATALGASGGIFGVLAAFAIRYPRERLPIPLFFIIWMPAFVVLLIFLGFNIMFAFTSTNIAWWGHFAGFLVGLAFVRGLPEHHAAPIPGRVPSGRGLPDAAQLEPLATTQATRRILERIRQFTPETRTADDKEYADAWLDQFFEKAQCPTCGGALERKGLRAQCATGDYALDFGRAK